MKLDNSVTQNGTILSWDGFFFLSGHRAGEESAAAFLSKWDGTNAHLLRGCFLACISDQDGDHYFIGNSGTFPIYRRNNELSTSMLQLGRRGAIRKAQIIELLVFGQLYSRAMPLGSRG